MSTGTSNEEVKRVEVTLKKAMKQAGVDKEPGEKIEVTPAQKERLAKQGII